MMRCHHYTPLSPHPSIVTASRLWLAILSVLALLAPGVAGADCTPDSPASGDTVSCSLLDDNGFDAPDGVDELQVDVLPDATVSYPGAADGVNTLNLNNDNVVDVQAGVEGESEAARITASATGSSGIAALDGNDITNSGSIEISGTNGVGISLRDNNGVGNEGDIIVSGYGGKAIVGQNDSVLVNYGTITLSGGDNRGIVAATTPDGWGIANDGTITAEDANSVALELTAGSADNQARNSASGEIILKGDDSVAIKAVDGSGLAYNVGTITVNGNGSKGIQVGNDNVNVGNDGIITIAGDNGIGMEGGDGTEVAWSFGTLEVTGASGIGMRFGDGSTLITSGTVAASGSDGIGVLLGAASGTAGSTLTNSGTIAGGSGSGVAVSFAPSVTGTTNTLENQTIGVIDGSASGVAILGSDGAEQITNQGNIMGDVLLGAGDDLFSLSIGGAVLDGALDAGDDSDTLRLEGAGTGTLDLSILSNFEVLDVASDGAWTLSGSGSFPEGATVTSGTLVLDGEVNLSDDYVQGEGTSLVIHLDPENPDPDARNDRLVVGGNATIEDGATLEVVATSPLTNAATYTFLTTPNGTLDGIFDEVNFPDDTGVLSFDQVPTATSLSIEISRFAYADAAATGNQTAMAIHLDEILAAGPQDGSDMAGAFVSLDMLSTSELRAALDALHPEAYDAQSNAIASFGRSVAELAAFRRPRCEDVVYERRPEIVAPSPCSPGWMPWGSAFGLFADRDGDRGHIDFNHGGGGLLLGADHPLGEHFLVYGFFGGGYTALDVDGVGDGTLFGATVGAGGRWSLGGSRIHALLGYAHGWHEQERKIDFGEDDLRISRTAKADYGSNLIMAFVKAGHTFRIGNLDLEPLATLEYGYLMEESFGESGARDLDLEVDERSNSLLSTTVGARLAYTFFKWEYHGDYLEWADGVWTPELTARWRGNWTGTERDLDARLAGAPDGVSDFTVRGQDAERGLQVGVGVGFRPLRRLMSIRVDYDGFYGDGSMIHRIGASIRIPLGGTAS